MKKLLFTGLMSVGFMLIGSQKESTILFSNPEHVSAFKYFSSKQHIDSLKDFSSKLLPRESAHIDPLDHFLSKISPTMSCSDINDLSEHEFALLCMPFLSIPPLYMGVRGDISEDEIIAYEQEITFYAKAQEMIVLIHQCRSIVPACDRITLEFLKEVSGEDFERIIEENAQGYADFDGDYSRLRPCDRIIIDAKDKSLMHPDNAEKLRILRAEFCSK